MNKTLIYLISLIAFTANTYGKSFQNPKKDFYPQTWFHLIGGNVAEAGLKADLEAVAGAGITGIQLFHGSGGVWPRTDEQIPCLSEKWDNLIGYVADECERLNLKFEMQNCPGWSMCGGPWVTHDLAMRKLVCFEEGKKPDFAGDEDFKEICTVEFPAPSGFGESDHKILSAEGPVDNRIFTFEKPVTVRSMVFPNHNALGYHNWSYEPDYVFTVSAQTESGWKVIRTRKYPRSAWQDDQKFTLSIPETTAKTWRVEISHKHPIRNYNVVFSPVARLENWEALAGWCFRDLKTADTPKIFGASNTNAKKAKLVFGHVNMRKRNGPAPKEATGWECDKLDPKGANAMFDAYIGRLAKGVLAGGKLKGLLLDSWECNCQTWTPRIEEYFRKINGYELRPNLPVIFGYPVADAATTEKFLRDWRSTLSRLVEENFYGVIHIRAKENNLDLQFETAFSDVVPGDAFRYWKYADIPMCEFWQPHDNAKAFVGSDDFKPVRPCVSAAHIYGKKRVAAEALTSLQLNWNENFNTFKDVIDHHLFRGVTKMVFHTYTHNPQLGEKFLPPGTSFGRGIGSPFLRGQTWWKFMPDFTKYLARCCYMLERGKPVVDVLWMFGDDTPYRPPENYPFPEGYKYDYCNADALITRAQAKNGRIVFPDGMSYTALWVPEGTFLLPETEAKIASLEKAGAKVIRGELKINWPSQLNKLGFKPSEWYQRRDGKEDIFFVRLDSGETAFITIKNGEKIVLDPITGLERAIWKDADPEKSVARPFELKPAEDYPEWATKRVYTGILESKDPCEKPVILSLGEVNSWAEVYVNDKKVSTLWCKPYDCNIGNHLKDGANKIKVIVTSTWYNKLVHELDIPEDKRTTWVISGPKKGAKSEKTGLIGPVTVCTDVVFGAPPKVWTEKMRREWKKIDIKVKSTKDGTLQPASFLFPETAKAAGGKAPLLVALHSWSYGYQNKNPAALAANESTRRGWAMLYPHFRGANQTPKACGSDFAVQDIVDQIKWAIENYPIDPDRVYIFGGSGGGHMALLMAGRHPELFAGAYAACPITDIKLWHDECLGLDKPYKRKFPGYGKKIEKACEGTPEEKPEEYSRRSPVTWLANARKANLPVSIITGIHDGHAGSVPIGHSIRAFNLIANEADRISEETIEEMQMTRKIPTNLEFKGEDPYFKKNQKVLLRITSGNARLTLFNAGHAGNYIEGIAWLALQKRGKPADWNVPPPAKKATESNKVTK